MLFCESCEVNKLLNDEDQSNARYALEAIYRGVYANARDYKTAYQLSPEAENAIKSCPRYTGKFCMVIIEEKSD